MTYPIRHYSRQRTLSRLLLPLAVMAWLGCGAVRYANAADHSDYLRTVKPVLAARCYACHGGLEQRSGLRLDTAVLLRRGGDNGPAVTPGKSGESLIIRHVTGAGGATRMPPESEGEALKPEEIAAIRRWIDAGAIAPPDEQPEKDPREHWAFRRPVRPVVPRVAGESFSHPIDAFLEAERQRRGLRTQPPADKRLLLRRVTLDLIGLPPTPAEVDAFLADQAPGAYERVVERLLASPRYGERWGRHFMDIWRYSDWWGLGAEVRNSQKHIWHWRDWIIESLNADQGYDQMLREMLAADELYPADLDKLRASGYLARSYFKFNRNTWLEEVVEHTSKAFLGLTANCAKCHDHKYDPIKQEDYYRLRAFFEPYQVRTDQAPGEIDFEKDGVPRAFDCNLDAPTYLFTRGDERQPLKDKALSPAVPRILAWQPLRIEPVTLPAESHQPGVRPHVLGDHLRWAEQRIAAARETVSTTTKQLDEAEHREKVTPKTDGLKAALRDDAAKKDVVRALARPEALKPLFTDDFAKDVPSAWEKRSGDWFYKDGKLLQRQDGDNRAAIRWKGSPPSDFEARFVFTPTGGKMWKSVGLSFDVVGENETLVYLSAYAGGAKLQVAYKQGGAYAYPNEGTQAREVKLGQTQDVVVRVRGPLINVQVDGQFALAYQLPIPRRAGSIELITYDCQAAFARFEIAELPNEVKLATAVNAPPEPQALTVLQARAALEAARKTLAAAEAQPAVLRARAGADRARFASPPANDAKALAIAAATAEKQLALLQAEASLAQAAFELAKQAALSLGEKKAAAPNPQITAADGRVNAAKQAVVTARKAAESPGENYTSLRGALKSVESNLESETSRGKPFPTTSTGRRTALAEWLTDVRNPLPARVVVNHVWARHFGRPLVATVFDFGRKGAEPTHPALLDYLAVELQAHGWSLKHLHRLLVTSAAYRAASSSATAASSGVGASEGAVKDPENRFYWRMNSLRMEAQSVRDSLLSLAGELDGALGGPSIHPVQAEGSRRRSLYFVHSHNDHHQFLSLFDDANVLECYRRSESIVPQQALALSNSTFASEMADRIAARLNETHRQSSDEEFIRAAFAAILGGLPTVDELAVCQQSFAVLKGVLPGDAAEKSLRSRVRFVHALLNHNDFVTIR